MRSRSVVAVLLALGLGACSPSVGDSCDEDAARTPYYRTSDGAPAYPGQALLLENCASCHNDPGAYGAPAGMELDAALVTSGGDDGIQQARKLLARQATIHRQRDLIHGSVVSGAMPPPGYAVTSSNYENAAGVELPTLDTEEGREMLRNWLACDSPVVERTAPLAQACSAPSDCVVTNFCDSATSQCVGVGDVVPARGSVDCNTPEANWPWIYNCVMVDSCAGAACHIGGAAGGLAMDTMESAFDALVGVGPGPMTLSCAGEEDYVVPNEPDVSLLVHKIEGMDETGAPACGQRMPIGPELPAEEIEAIRMWIMDGATETAM